MEFYNEYYRTARKPHTCECCRKTIEPGEKYCYQAGKFDGDFFVRYLCDDCSTVFNWYSASDYCQEEEFQYWEIEDAASEEFCETCVHGRCNENDCSETSRWHCQILLAGLRDRKTSKPYRKESE